MGPAISVCIAAWNEAGTLESVVEEITETLDRIEVSREILIIDDGSRDGTSEIADQLAAKVPAVRVIHHHQNRGLGAVYRTGLSEARGTFISFLPADGQFPAQILAQFYALMPELDLCLGFLRERGDTAGKALSFLERLLYRTLLGPMPRFQGVLMLRRTVLEEIQLSSPAERGWGIVMELILRVSRRGYRVRSVETSWRARARGTSKVNNLKTVSANLGQLVRLRRMGLRDG